MVNIQNKMRFAGCVCLLKTRYCYIVAAHMLYNTFFLKKNVITVWQKTFLLHKAGLCLGLLLKCFCPKTGKHVFWKNARFALYLQCCNGRARSCTVNKIMY